MNRFIFFFSSSTTAFYMFKVTTSKQINSFFWKIFNIVCGLQMRHRNMQIRIISGSDAIMNDLITQINQSANSIYVFGAASCVHKGRLFRIYFPSSLSAIIA